VTQWKQIRNNHIISTVGFVSHTEHGVEGNYPKFTQYFVTKQARIDFW